jgi:hypothetical protein
MTQRHKHPSAHQLASLAAGALRPCRAARIRAHIAQCEQCTGVCQQFNAIRAILSSATYPPMPDNLSARIDAAIRQEARRRLATMPATEDGRRDPTAGRRRAGIGGGWRLPGLLAAETRLAAAACAVVIAVAGSYLVAGNVGTGVTPSPSSALASSGAPAQQMSLGHDVTYGQPGSFDTIRAVKSHTNFVAARLRTDVISAVHAAQAIEAFAGQPSASTAAQLTSSATDPAAGNPSARQLAGCIELLSPGRTILLIDIASYQGKPAAVIVTAPTLVSKAEAWAVGSSCSATTKDVLAHAALGNL